MTIRRRLTRKPMTPEQAQQRAQAVLNGERNRIPPGATRSDAQAFARIKRTGQVPNLANDILKAFEHSDAEAELAKRRGENPLEVHRRR